MKNIHWFDQNLQMLEQEFEGRQHIEVSLYDPYVDWDELAGPKADTSQPALNVGQQHDTRYDLWNGGCLHAQWFYREGVVRFHLDRHNPRIDGMLHLTQETYVVEGSVSGALFGLALGTIFGAAGGWLTLCGGLGAVSGGLAAAHLERPSYVWILKRDDCFYQVSADFSERLCCPHGMGAFVS